jgi:beta-carotene hydroxylase
MYMPLHEATHGNISGRHGNLRWVDDLVGSISAVPMWFSYKAHAPSHMHHHAYTNDPHRDPDHFIAGPFSALFGKHLRFSIIQIVFPLLAMFGGEPKRMDNWLLRGMGEVLPTPYEAHVQTRFLLACLAVFVALSLAGFFWQVLLLWYLPARLGFFVVMALFAWLPHLPHVERGRYRDTRVTLFPFGTAVCRGHNHHILHHMFPRVPHYKLRRLFREMRPLLEEHDVRIEGPLAGPGAPKMMLRWNPEPASSRAAASSG